MKAMSIGVFISSLAVTWALCGCSDSTSSTGANPPGSTTDPAQVPDVPIKCTGAAKCAENPPECGDCVDCIEGFCAYEAIGTVGDRSCKCYDGEVALCYYQVASTWRLGIKRCARQSDGKSFDWRACGAMQP